MLQPVNTIQLINILLKVQDKITPETDVLWTSYNTPGELAAAIDKCIVLLTQGKDYVVNDIALLFAPTGALQEVSLSNGWEYEFLEFAADIDKWL